MLYMKNPNNHSNQNPMHASPRRPMRLKWLRAMLVQILITLAAYLLLDLSLWLGGALYFLCKWVLMPVCGLLSACIATRAGFFNYLAFLVPPLMSLLSSQILWGYLPQPAPVFVCGFASLVGAAAGEVLKQSKRPHKK